MPTKVWVGAYWLEPKPERPARAPPQPRERGVGGTLRHDDDVAGADARVARVRRPAVRAVDRVRLRDEALRLDPGAAEGEVRRAEGAEGLERALEPRFMAAMDQAEPAFAWCHAVEVNEDEEVGAEDQAVAPHGVPRHRRAADA